VAKRGEPDDAPDFSDPEELERAVTAEHYRQWRELDAAGMGYVIPSADKIREELTRPERERREAEEAEKRRQREARMERIEKMEERKLRAELAEAERNEEQKARKKRGTEYPRASFWEAVRLLGEGKLSKREIARQTKLHRDKVDRVEDWRLHPGRNYDLESRPIDDVLILRRR
jgi:flagellar biosynthesis GTPase FlhF